jgi:cytochrome P450
LPRLAPVAVRGPRALPFLGATDNLVRFFSDPVSTLLRIQEEFGSLATLADRDPAVICAFGEAYNRAVLSDQRLFHNMAEALFDVPEGSAPTRLSHALTGMNDEQHKRHRRLLLPAFQKSALEAYRHDVVAVTDEVLSRVKPGDAVDVSALVTDLTMRIAVRCLFGVELPADRDEGDLGNLARRYLEGLISVGAMLAPYDLPGTPFRRFMRTSEELERQLRPLINGRRQDGATGSDSLSILLRARDERDGTGLSDDELMGQATMLFIAGHETTSYTLTWTLFLLSQHPDIQAAVEDEVRGGLGASEDPALLPLLDGVIKESQRLLPATPFLFVRRATAEFKLGGHAFPAEASVILSPLLTHRNPELFPEPLRFRPERWEKLRPTPFEYLPFGAGPRMCLGAGFAAQVLRVILPMMLQRFRFQLSNEAVVSTKVQGITLGPRHGLPMKLLPKGSTIERPRRVRGDIHRLVALA